MECRPHVAAGALVGQECLANIAADVVAGPGAANSDATITRLRTMVASLKEGASFCKRLGAALQQVQVLLASTQAPVVHDAIVFITMCK